MRGAKLILECSYASNVRKHWSEQGGGMQVQIDLWELLVAVATLISAFASVVWLFGTILVRQFKSQQDERFDTIRSQQDDRFKTIHEDMGKRESEDREVSAQFRQFEKDFLQFQISMPENYVRREDYIRGQTVIESKQDALYSKMELVQMQIQQGVKS